MTQAPEPRWRRLEPDQRRQQILAAAARQFGSTRYSDVSVAEIAEEAGVARGLVNHYFGTKRKLYLAVVRTMMFVPPVTDEQKPGGSRRERIEAGIDWLMDMIEAQGLSWLAIASAGGIGSDPEVQELLDAADDRAAENLLRLVDFRGMPAEREVALGAVRAFGGMVKAMGRELIERRSLSSAEARRQLVVALDAVLTEVAPPARPPV